MTSIKTIAAAGLLSVMTAAPAFAQAAIQEPGLFAFYHPNLDVLNGGAPTPAYRLQSLPPSETEAYALEGKRPSRHARLAPPSNSSPRRLTANLIDASSIVPM
jgi:hypothetical protein